MVRFAVITVVLLDKTTVTFNNNTLKEVATACLELPLADKNPLLIVIREDYKLYFDKNLFLSWATKEISLSALIEDAKTDGLLRNKVEITFNNEPIDPGALWVQKWQQCILLNDDFFACTIPDDRFEIIG
ncbi:hypothetical protein ACFFU1_16800 [Algibacter miyuki]|uniref:Uncharacterized protein n=1 Tax=Algibacter miyuki TaxID=1306933 RepID=A0ABV5H3W8_9FLAO|nr:hypothetical protein [Algibacter miyuki]MDN3665639.1 hypothetical protein [Algibacter miyuki]